MYHDHLSSITKIVMNLCIIQYPKINIVDIQTISQKNKKNKMRCVNFSLFKGLMSALIGKAFEKW